MYTFEKIALTLVIIGALNWGLIGFFNYDLVAAIFGGAITAGARVVYALVGLAGLICLAPLFRCDRHERHDHD
ncbi:MAG: DUF378 domain-containing protein [Bacillota bacterium]